VGQEEQPGPILSLVGVRTFEQIFLFSTPGTVEHTQATKDVLEADDLLISEPITAIDPLARLPKPSAGFSLESI
jgi:hypothetical protein